MMDKIEDVKNYPPNENSPVTLHNSWLGRVVITRETPVEIIRLCFPQGEEPYAVGQDAQKRNYKFPLKDLKLLARPIEGVVVHGQRLY